MAQADETKLRTKIRNRRVHMANERTFLAWVRTAISIMAFGFVVEKFSLFVKQMAFYLGKEDTPPAKSGYSSIIGIVLVGLGLVMGVLAFMRYRIVARQIDDDAYRPSPILSVLLTLAMATIGLFLILYLIHSM